MFERWDEVELDLKVEATLALDDGHVPEPLLAAFDAHAPMAVVGLRPFDDEGILAALVEVLALVLPLGARRLALGLPGHAREDVLPAAGAVPDDVATTSVGSDDGGGPAGTAGTPLLVVATAEAVEDTAPALSGRVLPLAHDGTCWQWRDDAALALDADAWDVTRALGALLVPSGQAAAGRADPEQLQAQLARCLLRGHTVALSPATAELLEPGGSDPGGRSPPTREG